MASIDPRAIYDSRTETVKTGSGKFVRIKELYQALAELNQVRLNNLIIRAKLRGAVSDPYEETRSVVVEDLVDLCRTRPQFCLLVVQTGREMDRVGQHFEHLLRDRAFGSSTSREVAEDHARHVSDDIVFDRNIGKYFFETRDWPGEFQYLVTHEQQVLRLSPGQRFDSHEAYEISFVIVRTPDGRYWLRWPVDYPDVPAYYMEKDEPVHFFPHAIEGENVDFEELFPGHVYEVFGVQFQLPDIGTDYSVYYDDESDAWNEWDPSEAKKHADRQEQAWSSLGDDEAVDEPANDLERLMRILQLQPGQVTNSKQLSKHFRTLSLKYHPLKHLDAEEQDKERIAARYLEITTAYNEIKAYFS
ncbi:MAG: hypothetical protein ACI9MC_000594 [Kiritimatiellia bacterium]|jgi:hypothetical protein